MDPSAILCRYKNSFDKRGKVPITLHTYKTPDPIIRTTIKRSLKINSNSDKNNKSLYDKDLKEKYGKTITSKIDLCDPFHNVSHSPFINRDAIILANIDMTFNFSDHLTGYILKQDIREFSFVTLDDGIGGFTQYLFYRNPDAYGYGISPTSGPSLDENNIDMNHFNKLKGPSGNGDLRRNYKHFISKIKVTEPFGVNLVVGNNKTGVTSLDYMVRLILSLNVLKIGGTFISKIETIDDDLILDLLYITTQCFSNVTLFKPLSEPFNIETNGYYVVAQDMKVNNLNWISYLTQSYGSDISGLLSDLPDKFLKWVEEYNNLMLLYNRELMEEKESKIYDTYKCKAIWNLPQI